MPHSSKLHIPVLPPTNYYLLAAQQELYKNNSWPKKLFRVFWKKATFKNGPLAEKMKRWKEQENQEEKTRGDRKGESNDNPEISGRGYIRHPWPPFRVCACKTAPYFDIARTGCTPGMTGCTPGMTGCTPGMTGCTPGMRFFRQWSEFRQYVESNSLHIVLLRQQQQTEMISGCFMPTHVCNQISGIANSEHFSIVKKPVTTWWKATLCYSNKLQMHIFMETSDLQWQVMFGPFTIHNVCDNVIQGNLKMFNLMTFYQLAVLVCIWKCSHFSTLYLAWDLSV